MGYNSISCPKCGVDLSIDESMRGTKITCPSCKHQMNVPSYTDESISVLNSAEMHPYVAPVPEPDKQDDDRDFGNQISSRNTFTVGVVLLLLILIAGFAVNAMLLVSLSSVKSIIRAQEERGQKAELQALEDKKISSEMKWEYKVVYVNGEKPASGDAKGNLVFSQKAVEDAVQKMGAEKWTLCNVFPLSETVFANMSEDKLIP